MSAAPSSRRTASPRAWCATWSARARRRRTNDDPLDRPLSGHLLLAGGAGLPEGGRHHAERRRLHRADAPLADTARTVLLRIRRDALHRGTPKDSDERGAALHRRELCRHRGHWMVVLRG